jgi:hypothetical protein
MELLGAQVKDMISLQDAASELGLSTMTLRRWCDPGIRGHRLKSLRLGGQIRTTRVWLEEFIAAMNEQEQAQPSVASAPSPARARHGSRHAEAERRLAELGV